MNNMKSNLENLDDKANDVRARAADSLKSAAESVRAAGTQSADTIIDMASRAGQKLDSAATVVRPYAGEGMVSRWMNSVRQNPVSSLAIAAAVGAVAGFACRNSSR
jgi:ElaB/YqjD/DUF883 family membrane-anchored ribosome-binding protein